MRILVRARRVSHQSSHLLPAREFDRAVAEFFMRLALSEARKGMGHTSPNPMVGAVLVKNGHVIARGFHAKAGGPHAEVVALRRAGSRAKGADLYVTLEPCNHQGRTPPCTKAILDAGIRRLFVGCQDVNPLVSGRGIRRLRNAGLPIITGVLKEECQALNEPFFTFITKRRPFVTLKVATTADGKIATATGDSRYVTGPKARERVHQLRDQVDAILVGASTIRQDNPLLTARPRGRVSLRQPLKVVLCSTLDLPLNAHIFRSDPQKVLVLTTSNDRRKAAKLEKRGVQVVRLAGQKGRVDLKAALSYLAQQNVVHLLVEGGAEVFGRFLEQRLADRVMLFIAPKIQGDGLSWAQMKGRAKMNHAMELAEAVVEPVGMDVLIVGRPR